MNTDSMRNGDVAGLGVFQNPYAFIAIQNWNGTKYVVMVNNGIAIDSTVIDTSIVYLRANAHYGTSRASFAYSLDNHAFTSLGNELAMQFSLSIFTGNKFCLFNYATIATGGYVDFDWFRTQEGVSTGITPNRGLGSRGVSSDFFLAQHCPNPCSPTTQIRHSVPGKE